MRTIYKGTRLGLAVIGLLIKIGLLNNDPREKISQS